MSNTDRLGDYWHPVAWAHELGAAPQRTVLLGTALVLWRDEEATPHCFADLCPHRGTSLSLGSVERGCLVCPYHGWSYDTTGRCVRIPQLDPSTPVPGRVRAESFLCQERYGIIWACLGRPAADVPAFPEWEDSSYRHVPCPAYTWRTSAARMVENFTDFGHLGYLHDGLLGCRDDLVVPEHRVTTTGGQLHYEMTMQVPNTNDRFAVTDVRKARGYQRNLYVLTLPHAIWLQCTYLDTGRHRTLYFAAQPRGDGESTGYCYQSRDFDLDQADEPYAAFQESLAEQDRVVVESQRPERLPLAMTDELHLPFDRVAVAYRRALAGLGAGR